MKWISVNKRQPENEVTVLIWPLVDLGIDVYTGYIYNGDWYAQNYEHYEGPVSVKIKPTHWTPLPTPPTEE